MSCEEAEAVGLFLKEHLTEVTMSKTYFSLVSNGTRDTESLKTFTDRSSSICSTAAAFLDRNRSAYCVSPASVLKADWLDLLYLIIYVKASILCDLLSFFDGCDAIAV